VQVSEGLDFANDNGRAVIITGIPYSPYLDPHVTAKKSYLDSKPMDKGMTVSVDSLKFKYVYMKKLIPNFFY